MKLIQNSLMKSCLLQPSKIRVFDNKLNYNITVNHNKQTYICIYNIHSSNFADR